MRAAVVGQRGIERHHVHGHAEAGGVFQRPACDQRIGHRRQAVGDADAAGRFQGADLGQRFAFQPLGQRAEHVDEGATGGLGDAVDADHHRRVVDHRPGIRRQAQRRDAGGERGVRFRAHRAFLRRARIAGARAQIDEAGQQPVAAAVDHLVERALRRIDDDAVAECQIADAVGAGQRIEPAHVADQRRAHDVAPVSLRIIAITAIRTAMPCSTCSRISERSP